MGRKSPKRLSASNRQANYRDEGNLFEFHCVLMRLTRYRPLIIHGGNFYTRG